MDTIQVAIWIMGGAISVIGLLVATLWQMTRAEQKAQDDAIKAKADKLAMESSDKRLEKELDRLRIEHEKVIDRVEGRFEKELENMENRLCMKIEAMEVNVLRQIELMMELLKKDSR